jgi:hypothetical protein
MANFGKCAKCNERIKKSDRNRVIVGMSSGRPLLFHSWCFVEEKEKLSKDPDVTHITEETIDKKINYP